MPGKHFTSINLSCSFSTSAVMEICFFGSFAPFSIHLNSMLFFFMAISFVVMFYLTVIFMFILQISETISLASLLLIGFIRISVKILDDISIY